MKKKLVKMIWQVLMLVISAALVSSHSRKTCDVSTFPDTFKFGAATAAYQIEGGWNLDGKGRSFWDFFMNTYSQYNQNATGNIACDSYHLYKEDVACMKEMGLDFYRFSISWSRILPKGTTDEINMAGVAYYNNLLDELEKAGIEPVVTLFHWDTPLALETFGTLWSTRNFIDYFVDYADLAFSLFGDRVKTWATLNEPKSICQSLPDYLFIYPYPELPLGTIEYLCVHHSLLAHATVYRMYQKKYKSTQKGRISIAFDLNFNMPLTNSTEDIEATERRFQFNYGWIANPLVYGDYPQLMKDTIARNSALQNLTESRLPQFTVSEKLMLKGSYDFLMLNTYTSYYISNVEYNNSPSYLNDQQSNTSQPDSWNTTAVSNMGVFYEGTRYVLKYVKETYNNPEIFISENGYSDSTGTLNDGNRTEYIKNTLQQVRLAMCEDEVNVSAYSYWSLLDNLEWSRGFGVKFGLVNVDFTSPNLTRTLKQSAYYYKNLVASRNLNITES